MTLLISWAVTSSVLILIVLAVRVLFRDRLSARLKYALWGVVLLRLLAPFQIELPAPVSDSLPVLATNAVPEVGQWEEPSIPVFPQEDFAAFGFSRADFHQMEPGEIIPTDTSIGYWQKSQDGETITRYLDLWSPAQVAAVLWGCGGILIGLVILASNLRFARRLRKRRERLEDVDAPIPVYTAEGLPSPCLFGVLKPAVYLTPGAAEGPDALRHVLAHELTHYRHRDHIWSALRCLVLALHWYNPLAWLSVVLSKQDGELACDEGAVARLGEAERIPYGRTLVDMVAARPLRPTDLLSCSTAMTGGGKSVKRRVAALVKKPETVKAALFAVVAVVALASVFTFAGRAAEQENTMLPDYLDRTTAIRYCPPPYSSTIYPNPIAREDLLAEAKEALSGFRYLEDGDPQPDLSTKELIHESRIILTFEGGEMEYSLLWQNDCTYLFPGSIWRQAMDLKEEEEEGETAQLQGVSGTFISRQGDNVISTLIRLASGQARLLMDPMPMLQSEREEYTRELLREGDTPLLGRPGGAGGLEFHYGCTSGDNLWLWYQGDKEHDTVWVLSLKRSGEELILLDDQPIVVFNAAQNPEERPAYEVLAPMAFAACLRPEDIDTITAGDYFPGQAVEADAQALAGQLSQAAYYEFSDEFDREKYGQLVLTIQVKEGDVPYHPLDEGAEVIDETASRRLVLSVGQEADAVCLYHQNFGYDRNMTSRQYVRSPELYASIVELARSNGALSGSALRGDLTQEQVDRANEAFQSDVKLPDGGWGPSEISCFFTSSYNDPTQIDLEEFLAYCPLAEILENDEVEEFQAVIAKDGSWDDWEYGLDSPGNLPVPVKRYPREKVSALLQKYAGVSVEKLDWSHCLYVEEYDAFYNFTSDFGPGFFPCAGGQIMEDAVLLWSKPDKNGERCELTLRRSGDRWLIQSHHTIYER